MKVQLEAIELAPGQVAAPGPGDVVTYDVILAVNDGPPRRFQAFVTVDLVPGIGLLNGDLLLQTLFRFEAAALARLLRAVGQYRRSVPVELPMMVVDAREEAA